MTKHNQENIFRSLLSIDQCRGGSGSCVTGFGPRSMLSPRHAASRVFHPSEFPCDSRDERRLFVGDKNFRSAKFHQKNLRCSCSSSVIASKICCSASSTLRVLSSSSSVLCKRKKKGSAGCTLVIICLSVNCFEKKPERCGGKNHKKIPSHWEQRAAGWSGFYVLQTETIKVEIDWRMFFRHSSTNTASGGSRAEGKLRPRWQVVSVEIGCGA